MSDFILFTAVGGHDPIANFRDGAILHICRVYKPKKVFIYLSKEMIERSADDDRYIKSLELLQKHCNFEMETVKIERDQLLNVHLFDTFYEDFEQNIKCILEQNENDTLLLNISSGTPAMKSALEIISAVSQSRVKSIQVATPERKENRTKELPEEFSLETYWELNEDNNKEFENRCYEAHSLNLSAKIKKETIISLLKAYNYTGALTVAEEIKDYLNKRSIDLITVAKLRGSLSFDKISKIINVNDLGFIPIKTSGDKILSEYLINLEIKRRQGNLADFIRGITPLILDLLEKLLFKKHKIDLKSYCVKRHNTYKLNVKKLEEDDVGIEILNILKQAYGSSMRETVYTSSQIYKILEAKETDDTTKAMLRKAENIEKFGRNIVAHEIVSVTEDWLSKEFGETSSSIMKVLKYLAIISGVPFSEDYFNSYDLMNETIIATL